MADNPDPSDVTEASWRFAEALLALEPGTVIAGIHVRKPGYHGTRAENLANWPGNYSIRHPLDLLGPADKAAAVDWTHRSAQSGDYRSMARYGDRLEAAFLARDPRLYGWHEAQGQTDLDRAPEELNFDDWSRGVPSDSHAWHWHFSEHRAFAESWDNKLCFLSILRGESLADYLARGGKLMTMGEDDDMTPEQAALLKAIHQLVSNAERILTCYDSGRDAVGVRYLGAAKDEPVHPNPLKAISGKLDELAAPVPVPVDIAALVAALKPEIEAAVRRVMLDAGTPDSPKTD